MYLGRLAELAPAESLYAEPRHPYTKALLHAVPEPAHALQRAKTRMPLAGKIPSPANPPAGCRFRKRCPLTQTICDHEMLAWRQIGQSVVACHLA